MSEIKYEGTALLNEDGEPVFGRQRNIRQATGQAKISTTHLLLFILIFIVSLILYIEVKRDGLNSTYQATFNLDQLDTATMAPDARKLLLEKLLASDKVEAELEQSGDDYEETVDQAVMNYETLEEEIHDDAITASETTDLEVMLNLTSEQVAQRFAQRKAIYEKECGDERSASISTERLNFTVAHLSNVFYDDKYKLIMCAVPKAATSNWQRVLAVLKYDGERGADTFHHSNLYNQLNRFSHIAEQMGEEHAKSEIVKRFNDPTYLKWINVRHPFTRLVSAWRDKFVRTSSGESYWMRKYGKFINAKFGRPEYAIPATHFVSLPAFLDYVAWVARDERYDHHWKSFNYHCRPCQLQFDYITKAETSGLDAKFILEKANVTHLVDLPGMYDTSPVREKSPEEFYMESSHETVHRLHHAYRHDFRLFGYSSLSFDTIAAGSTPSVFTMRRRRRSLLRQHERLMSKLESL